MSFSARSIEQGLAPFQRATVDAAMRALNGRPNARFLVADEVGLGKTRVARGVVARLRDERERSGLGRMRVVYLSSNLVIARQNAPLLLCDDPEAEFSSVDRVTLLPTARRTKAPLEVLAFTPGTSLSMGTRRDGRVKERALLARLVSSAQLLGSRAEFDARLEALFAPPAHRSFPGQFRAMPATLPRELIERFRSGWSTALEAPMLAEAFSSSNEIDGGLRRTVVGGLRRVLAQTCLDTLGADLIVVDEFQRFLDALDQPLAQKLLTSAPVLLLSATPFADTGPQDQGLLRLVRLLDQDNPTRAEALERALISRRDGLLQAAVDNGERAYESKITIEALLRPVMARTERRSADRVVETRSAIRPTVTVEDIQAFVELDEIGRDVRQPGAINYWKTAPHPLTFMDDYELARRARRARRWPSSAPRASELRTGRLSPGNGVTRALLSVVHAEGGWQRPWLAPSLPYVEPAAGGPLAGQGPETKLLVFTGWAVAPKAIASMVSHDVRMATRTRGKRASRPLQVRRAGPMTELVGFVPAMALAAAVDPIELVRANGGAPLPWTVLRRHAQRAITARLPPAVTTTGRVDRRWYAVAPLLLDNDAEWLSRLTDVSWVDRRTDLQQLASHPERLRRRPPDLAVVLAEAALGPAACVHRSLLRHFPDYEPPQVRMHAARIADRFRSLLDQPEPLALARRVTPRANAEWRRLLRLSVVADLAAVVDEHVAALVSWAPAGSTGADDLERVATAFREALALPAVPLGVHVPGGKGKATMTTRAAMRIPTTGVSGDERKHVERLRLAFNSPFPPYLLATTSVGQEGLDFHLWCHAVVHWNLPRSPIVFEQREGRVDRFRGHLQRRNIAESHRQRVLEPKASGEPWAALWEAGEEAAAASHESGHGLSPSWVSPGEHQLHRHLPHLPMSAERAAIGGLLRQVALYRLTLGQPDPERLLDALNAGGAIDERLARKLVLDLTPPAFNARRIDRQIGFPGVGQTL